MVPQGVSRSKASCVQCHLLWHTTGFVRSGLVPTGSSGSYPDRLFLSRLQATNARLAALNKLQYSVWISRGAGLTLAFDAGLLLVPVLRNIIRIVRPKLTWMFPADENIWFHRQVAYSMAFWAMVHTTAHYVNFFNVELTRMCRIVT